MHTHLVGTDRSVYTYTLYPARSMSCEKAKIKTAGDFLSKNILCTSETNHFKMAAIRAGAEAEVPIKERATHLGNQYFKRCI